MELQEQVMTIQTQHAGLPMRRSNDGADIVFCDIRDHIVADRTPLQRRRELEDFEIRNVSGKTVRGVEIELSGFGKDDLFQAYYLNRCGAPRVSISHESIRVCFESLHRLPVQSLSQTTVPREKAPVRASQPFVLEFGLFSGGGSDRFCIELSTLDIVSTYRWLIATNESVETLMAYEEPAYFHNRRN